MEVPDNTIQLQVTVKSYVSRMLTGMLSAMMAH